MSNNYIDGTGIHTDDLTQIITDIVQGTPDIPGFQGIYGADVITDSNTPDGQMINIFALAKKDMLDLMVSIYNSFDPDQAVGSALDALAQICGIRRKGGTYTLVSVSVTVSQSTTLPGMDQTDQTPFTIADASGNQFQLIASATISIGTHSLNFQSVKIGNVQVLPSTLTIPVTIILGVTSVTNAAGPYQQGEDQETDSALRLRRQKSTATPAQGVFGGLLGALLNISGVTAASLYENTGTGVDANGVPAKSIWAIVDGGTDADIADIIYRYRSAGCGMKGDTVVDVTQIDGSTIPILFDRAVEQNLYVQFTVTSLSGGAIDSSALKTYLQTNYIRELGEAADITSIAAAVNAYSKDLLIYSVGVSRDGITYVNDIFPDDKKNKWLLLTANINVTVV